MSVFDVYFSQIVGIQYHPANPPDKRMSLEDCARVAARMMVVRSAYVEVTRES